MQRQTAFTLIEMLLVIALLALMSTVLISGTTGFFQMRDARPDQVFWQAVTQARQQALDHEETVYLRFDPDAKQLVWSWPDGKETASLHGETLRFLPAQTISSKLLGGMLVETGTLPGVHFYPDGTCDAFRAELTSPEGKKDELRVDPWTCAPMLSSSP